MRLGYDVLKRRRGCGLFVLSLIVLGMMGSMIAQARVSFSRPQSVKGAGITMAFPEGFELHPTLPPHEYSYTRNTTPPEKFKAIDPRVAWIRAQVASRYSSYSRVVEFAIPTYSPLVFADGELTQGGHVVKEIYQERLNEDDRWDKEALEAWVEDYAGFVDAKAESGKLGLRLNHPYLYFTGKSDRPEGEPSLEEVFVFKLRAGAGYRFLMVGFSSMQDNLTVARVLQTMVPNVMTKVRPLPVASSTFQKAENRVNLKRKSLAYREARSQVINDLEGMAGWWFVDMPNYLLVSNMTRGNKPLVDKLQDDLELLRGAFKQLFPPIKESEHVSVIRMFNHREEYIRYVGERGKTTIGLWMPSRNELVISPSSIGTSLGQKEEITNTAYHEAMHQYIYYSLDKLHLPIWMDEGHACLFETTKINKRTKAIEVRENTDRLRTYTSLRRAGSVRTRSGVVRSLSVGELVSLNHEGFIREDTSTAAYVTSWALVYYLRKGVAFHPNPDYGKICDRVLKATLENPRDPIAATRIGLQGIDLKQLDADMDRFYRDKKALKQADKFPLFK